MTFRFPKNFASTCVISALILVVAAGSQVARAGTAAVQGTNGSTSAQTTAPACKGLLEKTFLRLQDEQPQNLCQYSGKVVLVVNTASYCGFTSQYEGLEKLYAKESARGLVVLGFPSNDFGHQEPGDSKQIAEFCHNTYGVKFPMFEKSVVSGSAANPLFKELTAATGRSPMWNFYKYLIGRNGQAIAAYSSLTSPDDSKLTSDIERALSAK